MTICFCPRHDTNGYLTSHVREDGNNYNIQGPKAKKRTVILDINALADISLVKIQTGIKYLSNYMYILLNRVIANSKYNEMSEIILRSRLQYS